MVQSQRPADLHIFPQQFDEGTVRGSAKAFRVHGR
jgi:hypothetical protein